MSDNFRHDLAADGARPCATRWRASRWRRCFGIGLASLLSFSRLLRDAIYPLIVVIQLVPKIAWTPLFIVWVGIGWPSRLTIATFIGFFPIFIAMMAGLELTDRSLVRLCRGLIATPWRTFWLVRLPASTPYLFAGLKIAITLAVIGVIVAEFISSSEGLGFLILQSAALLRTDIILAAITVLCLVGLVCYGVGPCGRAGRAPMARRMTDIGLHAGAASLARPRRHRPRRGAAGRAAVVLAILLLGGWEALSRGGTLSARLLPAPSKVFDTLVRSLGVLLEQAQPDLLGRRRRHLPGRGTRHRAGHRRLLLAHPDAGGLSHHRLLPAHPQGGAGAGLPDVVRHRLRRQRDLLGLHRLLSRRWSATITGLQAAPTSYERLCRGLMMSRLQIFLTVKFPFALPHIFSGLRIGVTFAVIGVVLGEFITAQTGLGYIILFSANNFETALLLAAILLLCGVGIVLFAFFLALEAIVMRLYDSR